LVGDANKQWNSRGHFFSAAAEAMRRILVEQARKKLSKKRGGDGKRVTLELEQIADADHDEKILALNEALAKLEQQDELKANLVKLRFFAGMTVSQTAAALEISTSSVDRYWNYARAWLQREMSAKR
jgi:RNA polymerase sigma factor (TIGR02999 family)